MLLIEFCCFLLLSVAIGDVRSVDYEAEKTTKYWTDLAQKELEDALHAQILNRNIAKNVILFIGDGMGVTTVTAGRIFKGQQRRAKGEETSLAIDKLKHVGLSKVYTVDRQVPDSASTATAFLCGVKTNFNITGLNAAASYGNCSSQAGNEVTSVLEDAYNAGKSTGIVSTTTLVHGTPSPAYAHSSSRFWEDDSFMSDEAKSKGCKDIAMQFYEASDKMTVVLSGGRKHMMSNTTFDPEYPEIPGNRQDGNNLIELWEEKMKKDGHVPKYVWNKKQLDSLNLARTDRLLGLFQPENMKFDLERFRDRAGEPSLAEMTETAIKMLRKNENGYFLFVEGGRIDHAHHANLGFVALSELVALDNAVEKAVEMTSSDDTLIIVSADHSHPFTISGYPDRGNSILGLVKHEKQVELAMDNKSYTTLTYANGPGFHGIHEPSPLYEDFFAPNLTEVTTRENITERSARFPTYMQQTAIPLIVETHAGEDVSIYASGPMAHLIHGVHEQNYIAHVIRYAACLGGMHAHCEEDNEVKKDSDGFKIDGKVATVVFACTVGLSAALYLKKTRSAS